MKKIASLITIFLLSAALFRHVSPVAVSPPAVADGQATPRCYFETLVQDTISSLSLNGGESDFEIVQTLYHHLVATTSYSAFDQPELTESWRYRDRCGHPPTIYEAMALGPLAYGLGTCEHYAAAAIVLLNQLGYSTKYVTGLTYSVTGDYVDHAWLMVQIDSQWYHLDPQMEDNYSQNGRIFYKYFLKNDAAFAADHIWGAALPFPDAYSLSLPACPFQAPTVPAEKIRQEPAQNLRTLCREALRLMDASEGPFCTEDATGSLPPLPRDMPGNH